MCFCRCYRDHRDLHSFPTRRSSDLAKVKVSPAAGDGKIYFVNGEGNCAVVRAANKFEVLATNSPNEATLSTPRSEEHTSELQSQSNLVCRLLLEQKTSPHRTHSRPT